MSNNFTDRQKELINRISAASRWAKRRRFVRLLTHPRKMLYAQMLKITKRSKEVGVQTFWGGEMAVVLPEDVSTIIWRDGYFEADVCIYLLALLQEGMTFVDIGSHFGFFTLLGSHLVGKTGKVLAFEPSPSTFQQLQKNTARYLSHSNVQIYNCAAYSEDKEIRFFEYGLEKSAYNSIFGMREKDKHSIIKNDITVRARKLDNILREEEVKSVDLIKIDAESSEVNVLSGMTKTLRSLKPNLVVEVGDFGIKGVPNSKEIVKLLQEMKYSAYEICDGEIVPHFMRERYEYGNLLFLANK